MRKINIITPSRIHLALIDLNGSLGRVDGGIGLTLSYPGFNITAMQSESTEIIGSDDLALRAEGIIELLKQEYDINDVSIEIEENIPSHVGLGSGTQLSLGVAQSICNLFDIDLTPQEIAFLVGRGGTSGIGVASFSQGGFIVDGGHEFSKDKICAGEKNSFLPSSASKGIKPPPIIFRHDFPDWDILITIPDCKHISGEDEVRLFQTLCPVSLIDVQSISHIVLLKLLPAMIQSDLESFADAVDQIQSIGWKKVEINEQDEIVRQTMAFLSDNGGRGVGLSSWGPAIFCFGEDLKHLEKMTNEFLEENNPEGYCFLTRANNTGAMVIDEERIHGSRPETANLQRSFH